MEGPTPVSALIHAATLVTAGIFLIIRCSPLFEFAPFTLLIVLVTGGITSLFGATTACAQNDLKKIVAFSTTSQLGYMCFSCGLSGYDVSLFHLFNHGFFKALLFLSSGVVINSVAHQQDLRQYGNFINILPFSYASFVIASFGLTGAPFMAGFYSKELIIELSFIKYNCSSYFIY
jgi:NADH-ubiquinone oxidoreductase chain 5